MIPDLGVADWTFAGSTEAAFVEARIMGLTHLQVDFGLTLEDGPSRANYLGSLAVRTGLTISAIGARLFNRIALPRDADACPRVIDAVLDFANALGVRQVFFPTFHAVRSTYDIARIAGVFSRACERAAATGISVAVESAQGAAEMARLLNMVGGSSLKVVPDTYNQQTEGNSFDELIRTHTSVLTPFLHIKDGSEGRMGVARLGCGDGEVAKRLSTALQVFSPTSLIIESRFSRGRVHEELTHDIAFVLQRLAEIGKTCPAKP